MPSRTLNFTGAVLERFILLGTKKVFTFHYLHKQSSNNSKSDFNLSYDVVNTVNKLC